MKIELEMGGHHALVLRISRHEFFLGVGWNHVNVNFGCVVEERGTSGDVELLLKITLRLVFYYRGMLEGWRRDGIARVNESGLACMKGPIGICRPHLPNIFFWCFMWKRIVGSHYIFVEWIKSKWIGFCHSETNFICMSWV